MNEKLWEQIKGTVQEIKTRMNVTTITCARTVRGRFGDEYLAMSVDLESVKNQDPSGQGTVAGMSIKEAKITALLLAMKTDIGAFRNAVASGLITKEHGEESIRMIKYNHARLLEDEFGGADGD